MMYYYYITQNIIQHLFKWSQSQNISLLILTLVIVPPPCIICQEEPFSFLTLFFLYLRKSWPNFLSHQTSKDISYHIMVEFFNFVRFSIILCSFNLFPAAICYFILKVKLNYCFNYVCMQLVSSHLPRWLEVLFTEKFFNACIIHEEERKNEKNIYCLDCCTSLCPHCLSLHGSHRLLQVLNKKH